MPVSNQHVDYAASLLGTKLLHSKTNQALILSNHTYLDRFDIHEVNRNVDMQWVDKMKTQMLKAVLAQECMTLTLAIDSRLIVAALEEPDNTDNGGFKAIILDGQHRWHAMRQLVKEMPSITFEIYLIVYLVNDDRDIHTKLCDINMRRNFSQADADKVQVTMRFLEAFDSFFNTEDPIMKARRCVLNVRKSPILKSEQFIKKHNNTSVEDFVTKLRDVADEHRGKFEASAGKRTVPYAVACQTGLYQLLEAQCDWLHDV